MKHRITAVALAATLTLGACSKGEQGMNDSAAGQTGAGTTDAQGANTTDTSAARAAATATPGTTAGAPGTTTGTTAADSAKRDSSHHTPTKQP